MSEETNNVVEETTEQDTPLVEEQQEESINETKPVEKQDIDYHQQELEKELEAERKRREKAENAARTKDIELKRLKKEDESIFDEETPQGLTEDRMREILREERESILAQSQQVAAKQLARNKAQSDAEAERIMLAYENKIRHSGDVESDVNAAWTLVNAHRLESLAEEQRRAFSSATSRGTGASAGSPQGHEGSIPPLPSTIPGRENFKLDKKAGAYVGTSGQTRLVYRNGDFTGQRLDNGSWVDND